MIKYAFFRDFKGSDSVLFEGDEKDLIGFSALLQRIAVGDVQGALTLDEQVGFRPSRATALRIHITSDSGSRCELIDATSGGVMIAWYLSPAEANVAADLVTAVASYDRPCHEYLETSGKIQIMVSKGEYPPAVFAN